MGAIVKCAIPPSLDDSPARARDRGARLDRPEWYVSWVIDQLGLFRDVSTAVDLEPLIYFTGHGGGGREAYGWPAFRNAVFPLTTCPGSRPLAAPERDAPIGGNDCGFPHRPSGDSRR